MCILCFIVGCSYSFYLWKYQWLFMIGNELVKRKPLIARKSPELDIIGGKVTKCQSMVFEKKVFKINFKISHVLGKRKVMILLIWKATRLVAEVSGKVVKSACTWVEAPWGKAPLCALSSQRRGSGVKRVLLVSSSSQFGELTVQRERSDRGIYPESTSGFYMHAVHRHTWACVETHTHMHTDTSKNLKKGTHLLDGER